MGIEQADGMDEEGDEGEGVSGWQALALPPCLQDGGGQALALPPLPVSPTW